VSRRAAGARIGLLSLLLAGAAFAPEARARGGEGGAPAAAAAEAWRWLDSAAPDASGTVWSPSLGDKDRLVAGLILPVTVTLAATNPNGTPDEASVVGSGVLWREDGLVLACWASIARLKPDRWLWCRILPGGWTRAVLLGGTWWADVGVVRVVSTRRTWSVVVPRQPAREDFGEPFLSVGGTRTHGRAVSSGRFGGMSWFDPDSESGRVDANKKKPGRTGKRAFLTGLLFADTVLAPDSTGAAVFDLHGKFVGLAVGRDPARPEEERVLVRPLSFLASVAETIAKQATFDPPDLGLSFEALEATAALPPDLVRARAKARGGAIVGTVLAEGPSNGLLWEGDVVLDVDGRPVFAEVAESFAWALLPLTPGVPADVTVWRGGRAQKFPVSPGRARSLWPDFQARHDAQRPKPGEGR
jgi:S1-C subfamily serine protease